MNGLRQNPAFVIPNEVYEVRNLSFLTSRRGIPRYARNDGGNVFLIEVRAEMGLSQGVEP